MVHHHWVNIYEKRTAAEDINGGVRALVHSGKGLRQTIIRALHGELKFNMRLTSLIMYISPALLFILYVGFSEAAPRVKPYDASPISRNPRSASETLEPLYTAMPNRLPEDRFVFSPLTGLTPSPTIVSTGASSKTIQVSTTQVSPTATTFQPPTTDTTTQSIQMISTTREQITALSSRISSSVKRSTDGQTSVFPPEKMLQTMVSMVSQRRANDAWSADSIDTSITTTEIGQGEYSVWV